ncbi:hypothetical protein D3C81_488320 [compost metagenome]
MVPVATVDDHRLLDPEAAGCTGRIHSGVAAAVDRHSPPQFGGRQALLFGQTGLFEETHRIEDLARLAGRNIDPLGQMGTDGHKDSIKVPFITLAQHILHLVVEGQRHPGRHDAGHLPIQHVAGQAVSGNTKAQHAARQWPRFADLHLMAEPVEVPGAGEAGGASANHQHLLATGRGRRCRQPAMDQCLVAEETFDGVDGDGFIHLTAVAGALAGVITDPAMDRRQRVIFDEGLPGRLEAARFGQGKPGLDVLASRTGMVARWQGRLPDGQPGADRACSRFL